MIREAVKTSEVIIFDCDGVLMNSNRIKEEGLVKITNSYFGSDASEFMRVFHRKNGGLSRRIKFQAVIERFAPHQAYLIEDLCHKFEQITAAEVLNCSLAKDCEKVLRRLRAQSKKLMVLSGTPSEALETVITKRRLHSYFERLMGSPTTKQQHLIDLHHEGSLNPEVNFIFIGDSLTDWEASKKFQNCRFFWSQEFGAISGLQNNSIITINSITELINEFDTENFL